MKRSLLFSILLLMIALVTWEVTVTIKEVPELILPKPTVIVKNLLTHLMSGYLLVHAKVTLLEILGGFIIGALVGIGLGFVVSQSSFMKEVLNPYIIASQAMPKLALAPLLTLWFGYGLLPKIVITALISFFPLFESTVAGLAYIDKDKLALFKSLRATSFQILMKLRLPTAIPYLMSGLRVAIVLSVVGATVSEFIGANQGLGAVITTAMGMMDTPLMFSAFILLTIIGILLYQSISLIEDLFLKKYYHSRRNDD
ncbi:ABC transporter permease [Litchfieldia alkalitelluris]|uniref:ABC transporter permease n=1 Tax=Litchfieldia alkalitelluris TaxID=304268 RepID=UPI0009965220|nr:ABC transporter permease [Litchfieldia alkalitelluris]